MIIDSTFWVAVSFIIFVGALVYIKVPQKINSLLTNLISDIKKEIDEAEKLKDEAKNILNETQAKLENSKKESEEIIKTAKSESEKMIIDINEKFFNSSENKKKLAEQKIEQLKQEAIKEIKDVSVKIAIESTSKIIRTSIDKSKLEALFNKNVKQVKNSLNKNTIA
tara:strand:+ start:44 stop:544 length:501 start_codon:yes stop_codon:yes gene_type:complete